MSVQADNNGKSNLRAKYNSNTFTHRHAEQLATDEQALAHVT